MIYYFTRPVASLENIIFSANSVKYLYVDEFVLHYFEQCRHYHHSAKERAYNIHVLMFYHFCPHILPVSLFCLLAFIFIETGEIVVKISTQQ